MKKHFEKSCGSCGNCGKHWFSVYLLATILLPHVAIVDFAANQHFTNYKKTTVADCHKTFACKVLIYSAVPQSPKLPQLFSILYKLYTFFPFFALSGGSGKIDGNLLPYLYFTPVSGLHRNRSPPKTEDET